MNTSSLTPQEMKEHIACVRDLIFNKQFKMAREKLAELGNKNDSLQYDFLYCDLLVAESKLNEALCEIESALLRQPYDWRLYDLKCRAYLSKNDLQSLSSAIKQLQSVSPPIATVLYFQEQLAFSNGDISEAINIAESAFENDDIKVGVKLQLRLFKYHCLNKDFKKCIFWLERSLALKPKSDFNITWLLKSASKIDPTNLGEEQLNRLCILFPENHSLMIAKCRLYLTTGKARKIREVIENNLSLLDEKTRRKLAPILDLLSIHVPSGNEKQDNKDPVDRREIMETVVESGIETAKGRLKNIDSEKERSFCSQLLDSLPDDSSCPRPLVSDFPQGKNMVVGSGRSSRATVIIFTGGGGKVCSLPISIFDRYLAMLNLDAIYLRDSARDVFLGGIDGLGSISTEVSVNINSSAPTPPLYCMSFSGGSFGAFNYCLLNKPKSVVMFSPFTHLFSSNESHYSAMQYLNKKYKSANSDFLKVYKKSNPEYPIHLVFGEKDVDCTAQVDRVSNIKNIYSHPIEDSGHLAPLELAARNQLLPLLRKLLREDTGP